MSSQNRIKYFFNFIMLQMCVALMPVHSFALDVFFHGFSDESIYADMMQSLLPLAMGTAGQLKTYIPLDNKRTNVITGVGTLLFHAHLKPSTEPEQTTATQSSPNSQRSAGPAVGLIMTVGHVIRHFYENPNSSALFFEVSKSYGSFKVLVRYELTHKSILYLQGESTTIAIFPRGESFKSVHFHLIVPESSQLSEDAGAQEDHSSSSTKSIFLVDLLNDKKS